MRSWLCALWKRKFTQTWVYWISDFQPPDSEPPSFLKKILSTKLDIKLVYRIQVLKTGKLASCVLLGIHRHTFERVVVFKFLLPGLPDPWDLLSSGRQQYFIKLAFSRDGFNLAISKQSLPPPFTWSTADTQVVTLLFEALWALDFRSASTPGCLSTSWGTLLQFLFLYSFPFSELFVVENPRAQSLDSCALSCHPSFDDSTELCAFEHHTCMAESHLVSLAHYFPESLWQYMMTFHSGMSGNNLRMIFGPYIYLNPTYNPPIRTSTYALETFS